MDTVKAIVKKIDWISQKVGSVVSWVLLFLIGLSCYEVFTRRFLGKPTIWTHEILSYLFCASILLCMGYTQLYKGHANIDIFYDRLSPKRRALADVVTLTLLGLFFVLVMLIDGYIFAYTSWNMQERTPSAFNFIIYPAKTLIPLGFFFLLLQIVADIIRSVYYLVKGEAL